MPRKTWVNQQLENMKVGIYARVSTDKQDDSLEDQITLLKDFCKKNKYQIYRVYSETASGAKSQRHELDNLMQDAKNKKFDAVVVLKLDRFSRSMLDLLNNVEKLKNYGVDFISVNDKIETHTPQGKLIFHVLGALAEFERSMIYERTKLGIERAKREGKICHRPKKEINLERVRERLKKGLSLTEIAALEKVSYGTLRNRLKEASMQLEKRLVMRT